ncbi:MAG: PAS domain S-box protein [Planctomycetota bacterium]|jgi:PAS domain S-box-containing protein
MDRILDHSDRGTRQLVEEVRVLRSRLAKLERNKAKVEKKSPAIDYKIPTISVISPEHTAQSSRISGKKHEAIGSFIKMLLLIFVCDAALMVLIEALTLSELWSIILDPILLALIMTPLLYRFVVNPITDSIRWREQAEDKLLESERRMREMLANVQLCTVMLEKDGTIIYVNDFLLKITGYEREEIIGRNWFDIFIVPEDREQIRNVHDNVLADNLEIVGHYENYILTKSGQKRLISWSNTLFRYSAEGDIVGTTSLGEDITDRKKYERELWEAKATLQTALEQSQAGIAIADANGKITFINKSGLQIGGKSEEELAVTIDKYVNSWELYHFDGRKLKDDEVPLARAIIHGQTNSLEFFVRRPGEEIAVWTNAAPIMDNEGKVVGGVAVFLDITERRRAEEQVRRQTDFLRSAIDSLTHPFYVIDADDYTIKLANREAAASKSISEGMTCYMLTHGLGKPCIGFGHQCPVKEVKKTKKAFVVEHVHRNKDGQERTVEVYAYPVLDKQGNVSQIIEYTLDITERKQAEVLLQKAHNELEVRVQRRTAELQEANEHLRMEIAERRQMQQQLAKSEELFSKAFYASPIPGTITKVSNDKLLMVNAAWLELVDFDSASEVIGKSAVELGLWADLENRRERDVRLEQTGHSGAQEIRVRTSSGRIRNCIYTAEKIDYENEPHILSMAVDITDRKQAEAALQAGESRFRELFENMSSAVAMYEVKENGNEFIFKDFNKAAEKSEKIDRSQVIGRSLEDVFPQVRQFGLFEVLQRVWKTGKPEHFPAALYKDERISGWRENYVYKLPSGEVVAIYDDITDRKQMKDREREHRADLVHVARLSTIGEMASAIAHEVNQPLTAISALAGGARRMMESRTEGSDEQIIDALVETVKQSQRAGEIVRRIRNFSRKSAPRRSTVNLNNIIEESLRFVESEISQKKIIIQRKLKGGCKNVFADPIQVEQVILNLLRNALDAMSEPGISKRELTVWTSTNDRNEVEVAVSDTGGGLEPDVAEKIFDSFFTTKKTGLGLGLSLSRTIVEAHGGKLWFTVNQDCGVTFRFTLSK